MLIALLESFTDNDLKARDKLLLYCYILQDMLYPHQSQPHNGYDR